MNARAKYLLKNTSLFALAEVATKVITFLLVPLYTYVLSREQYGTVDLVFTIATLLTPLVMFNIGEAMMRFLLDKDIDDSQVRQIEWTVIVIGLLVSALSIPLIRLIPRVGKYAYYASIYIAVGALQSVTVCYLRGKERLVQYAICNILNATLIAGLNILFLVVLRYGVEGYLLAYILAYAITAVLAFFLGEQHKNFNKVPLDTKLLKKMVVFSLAVIPNSLMWWVIHSSDHLMVSYMRSFDENGLLTVAYKIPALLSIVANVAMQGWKYSAINERESSDREEFNNKIFYLFFRGMLLLSAVLLLCNKVIVGILYADAYHDSWRASSYLLFGNAILATATFFGTSYYVEKKMLGNLISAMLGAVINILLNVVLIPLYGAAGATMAAAFSYVVIMIYRYFDTQKFIVLRFWTLGNTASMLLLLGLLASTNLEDVWLSVGLFSMLIAINFRYLKSLAKMGIALFSSLRKRRENGDTQ